MGHAIWSHMRKNLATEPVRYRKYPNAKRHPESFGEQWDKNLRVA